jgi:hypothetical protein
MMEVLATQALVATNAIKRRGDVPRRRIGHWRESERRCYGGGGERASMIAREDLHLHAPGLPAVASSN